MTQPDTGTKEAENLQMTPQRLVFLLCQAIAQPPQYTEIIKLIDYDKFGVYAWSQFNAKTSEWTIPLTDGSAWVLTISKRD